MKKIRMLNILKANKTHNSYLISKHSMEIPTKYTTNNHSSQTKITNLNKGPSAANSINSNSSNTKTLNKTNSTLRTITLKITNIKWGIPNKIINSQV